MCASAVLPLLAAAVTMAFAASPAWAQGTLPHPVADPADTEMLHPGDVVRITVWRKPELSGEFSVSADGTIADPFYMGVEVTGISVPEAAARLRTHIERFEVQPRVLIEPLFRVAVGGEVQRPDVYLAGDATSISHSLLLAGGPTADADLGRIWLIRGGDRLRVNLKNPREVLSGPALRSGDYVIVERARDVLREYVLPTLLAVGAASSIVRLVSR